MKMQDERETAREIAGLWTRDYRTAGATKWKMDYALEFEEAERLA